MDAPNQSASVASIQTGTAGFSPTPYLIAAVILFLVSTLGAFLQAPRTFPLKPDTLWESFYYPDERNAFQRMPQVSAIPRDVFVVPGTEHLWIVGDKGLSLHSPDGGTTWKQLDIDFNIRVEPSIQKGAKLLDGLTSAAENLPAKVVAKPDLASMFFSDSNHGWVVGDHGTIMATVDGGISWKPQNSKGSQSLRDVHFLSDGQRGWAVGSGGTILSSSNAGESWILQDNKNTEDLFAVYFSSNGKNGSAVGSLGTILVTDDAGDLWVTKELGGLSLKDVHLLADGQQGWAVGMEGRILVTPNGGKNWNTQTSTTREGLERVQFLADGKRGWVAGEDGTTLVTIDGGQHWKAQDSQSRHPLLGLRFAVNGQQGWAIYLDGTILGTADGGNHWEPQARARETSLSSVQFLAEGQHGWAVGSGGNILTTTDGGRNWKPQDSKPKADLSSIYLLANGQRGWAVGDKGTIMTTTDGGRNWMLQSSNTHANLKCVSFLANGQQGWVVGDGKIMATRNGGKNWESQDTDVPIACVQFQANGQNGWAVGYWDGTILATSDGGKHWDSQVSNTRAYFRGVHFMSDGPRGWVVGEAAILATPDGGKTWKEQIQIRGTIEGVQFLADGQTGWAAGDDGNIMATVNGGENWQLQNSETQARLKSVQFLADGQRGWVVGDYFTILSTADGGKTWRPVEYRRYPAPWYWLSCILWVGLAFAGALRPARGEVDTTVADVLASDRPLRPGEPDRLDFAGIAAGVSKFLRNPRTEPPLTVAITGEWGSGKSSLMNLICHDLKRANFSTVWFNAWHHQKGEQILASLFANIRVQAIPSMFSRAGLLFRLNLLRRRGSRHWLLLTLLIALFSASLAYVWMDLDHLALIFGQLSLGPRESLGKALLAALPLSGLIPPLLAAYNASNRVRLGPRKVDLIRLVRTGQGGTGGTRCPIQVRLRVPGYHRGFGTWAHGHLHR